MSVDTKLEITASGGRTISAHVSDWELASAFPAAITREIVNAIASRFVQEHGEAIMKSLMKPEFIVSELPKAVESHLRNYFTKKREEEVRRNGKGNQ